MLASMVSLAFSALLWLSLIVLPNHCFSAQMFSQVTASTSQLPDAPSFLVTVSSPAKHLAPNESTLSFRVPYQQTEWPMRSLHEHIGFSRIPANRFALLPGNLGSAEAATKRWCGSGSAQTIGTVFARGSLDAHRLKPQDVHHWDHYSNHIPWAGPVVVRVTQQAQRQAKAHPNITRLVRTVRPKF